MSHGLVVLTSVIPLDAIAALAREVNILTTAALQAPLEDGVGCFGEIREPLFRCDLKLHPSESLVVVLQALVAACADPLTECLGPDPGLCELSALSSDPGARRQPLHCDTTDENEDDAGVGNVAPHIVSVFLPLSDLDPSMGPTLMLPGSHKASAHRKARSLGPQALLRDHPHVVMDLSAGDVVLMDSRLWHCGGANQSSRRRTLLVVSFNSKRVGDEGNPSHPPFTEESDG